MTMSDARKRRLMWEVLGGILLLIVVWIVIQLAIGANHAAAEEEKRERCLASSSDYTEYGDCLYED
ncbi:hypothetical protein QE392_001401 [Microbacterium proteolyticum]|uniref:hypothetical protein n=1 Tax=Microbacterium proteolyticum TaxID=1572644 RepID=UPI002780FBAA|nr:hypothetical protein [Microbacterium proteolyticum]MDQ1169597.1 hypothetical protein [Microbacterium proteolyticum]